MNYGTWAVGVCQKRGLKRIDAGFIEERKEIIEEGRGVTNVAEGRSKMLS